MTSDMMQPVAPPSKMTPALIGGAVIGFISATPFLNLINCLCCAGIILGGFLATFFYKDQLTPDMPPMTPGDGATLGLLSGLIGFAIATLLGAVIYFLFGNIAGEIVMNMMLKFFETAGIDLPPEAMDEMMRSADESPFKPLSLFISLVVTTIFAVIGGLIGSAVFKSKPPQIQQ